MKVNADKCHLLVAGNYEVSANINEFEIESSKKEKLLGISIDTIISFEHHITSLCQRISQNLHALARKAYYMDFDLSFSELQELDNAVTIHQTNLQVLVTEIFKVKNNLSPEIMKQVLDFQEPYYNLRSETSQFRRENIKTTHYGIQSVKFLGPKI